MRRSTSQRVIVEMRRVTQITVSPARIPLQLGKSMKTSGLKRALILTLASFAVLHGSIFWHLRDSVFRGYFDFASFYTAGKIMQHGKGASLYDLGLQWQVQQEFAASVKTRTGPLPYIRPPFEALLFLPFAYLNYPAAFLVWTCIKMAVLFTIPFLLAGETPFDSELLPEPRLQGLLSLGFYPIALDLLQGQDSILLLLLLALVFTSLRDGSGFRSGVYLGLGLFKFHLVIPILLVLLLNRKTRTVLGFLCTASVLLLVSLALVGRSAVVAYPEYVWNLSQTPARIGINSSVMPNIRGLLTPFLGVGRVPLTVVGALLGVSIFGIVRAATIWRPSDNARQNRIGFSFCIVVILVTSYYTTSCDLALLILPLLFAGGIFATDATIRGWPRWSFVACTTVLLCSPFYLLLLSFGKFFSIALVLLLFAMVLAKLARKHPDQVFAR